MELADFDFDEELFLDNEEAEDIIIEESENIVVNQEKKSKETLAVMTIYEKNNIIKERIKQLDNNYKTTLPDEVRARNLTASYDIAILEFDNKALPNLEVIRRFPDGSYEKWKMEDFEFFP